jgi:hypothetical protein
MEKLKEKKLFHTKYGNFSGHKYHMHFSSRRENTHDGGYSFDPKNSDNPRKNHMSSS